MSNTVVNTPLTPNSKSVATATFQNGNMTVLQFQAGGVAYWSPSVSVNFTRVSLPSDVGNATVTFKAGLSVQYVPQTASSYMVTVTGQIVDSGTVYPLSGMVVGVFTSPG